MGSALQNQAHAVARYRMPHDMTRIDGGSDVVVQDPILGEFSLHGGFELQTRQMAQGGEWRRVSVDELKDIIASAVRKRGCEHAD